MAVIKKILLLPIIHKEVYMSLYIKSENLDPNTYSQLLTQASDESKFLYYSRKEDSFCILDEKFESYQRVSGQKIYELSLKYSDEIKQNPIKAEKVSASIQYFNNKAMEGQSKKNPILLLIMKIIQIIKNLFKGHGFHTEYSLLNGFANELVPAQDTTNIQLTPTLEPRIPLNSLPQREPKIERDPTLPQTDKTEEQSSEKTSVKIQKSPPSTIKHAHSQRKLSRRQSMNLGKLCLELRLAGDIHQFEEKIAQMSRNRNGIFQLFSLDGGPAEKFEDSRQDVLTKILKPLDFDKRKIMIKYLIDFPSFNPTVFCDLFHVLFIYEQPENEYQVTDSMKLLRRHFQDNQQVKWDTYLQKEEIAFLSKQSIPVG